MVKITFFQIVFTIGLLSGSINSLTMKIAYQTQSVGLDGILGYFGKPWLMSLVMFLSMTVALPLYFWIQHSHHSKPLSIRNTFILALPSLFDLLGSSMQQVGLVLIPVSVYQMLKGSIMLFSAILSVGFLNRRMRRHHWLGVFYCCSALVLVGFSSVLAREDQVVSTTLYQNLTGISFVILGQIICASQYIIEEFLLKPPNDLPALALVGVEGFWGSFFMMLIVLPLLQRLPGKDVGRVAENFLDAVTKLEHSKQLCIVISILFLSCFVFNICGVVVTQQASAVHHTFLDATRTIFIWIGSLSLYYFSEEQSLGEPLTTFSWLQGIGFILLLYGELLYDGNFNSNQRIGKEEEETTPMRYFESFHSPRVLVSKKDEKFPDELTEALLIEIGSTTHNSPRSTWEGL